jgi:dipeptidyl aminopeptidase/acylaminoacyl peptidase
MLQRVWRISLILTLWHAGLAFAAVQIGLRQNSPVLAFTYDAYDVLSRLALRDVERGLSASFVRGPNFFSHVSLPSWSPSGEWLVWLQLDAASYWMMMRWDDLTMRPLAGRLPAGTLLTWSPDERQVVFERLMASGQRRLMLVDVPDGTPQFLPEALGVDQTAPSWSPDGRWIAYQMQTEDGVSRVALYDTTAQQIRILGEPGTFYPAWSPNGQTLAYLRYGSSTPALVLHTLADNRLRLYPFDEPLDFSPPQWSPDGRWLAFVQGPSQVWLLDTHTDTLTRLTPPNIAQFAPRWSPNGRALVVNELAPSSRFARLTLIDLHTGHQRPLAPIGLPVSERMPAWMP